MKSLAPFLLCLFLFQCKKEDEPITERLLVNAYKVPCTGFIPQECYLVKQGEDFPDGEWTYFYSAIEGFDYTPGYIYDIEAKKIERNPVPQDVGRFRYIFYRLVSKTPED